MKSLMALISVMFLVLNISIPGSYRAMEVFDTDASIYLADFIESTDNDSSEDQNTDISEEEVEVFTLGHIRTVFSRVPWKLNFLTVLPVFISSYLFSIDIPPLF